MRACNFIKKETLAQVCSYEFYEIFKNTFFTEPLWAVASDIPTKKHWQLEISVGKQKTKMMNELRFFDTFIPETCK